MRLTVGTRGSPLALTQTNLVLRILSEAHPAIEFVVVTVKTLGDLKPDAPMQQLPRGVFARELESALAAGEIDLAVHSFKDLPTKISAEFTIAATGKREDPRDVLVAPSGLNLAQLSPGSRVGTSSPRRLAQVRAHRRDLNIMSIRGNVETRIRKAREGAFEAVILAAAGMLRLGLGAQITEFLDPAICLPSAGQGVLALEVRSGDRRTADIARAADHHDTHVAVAAENAVLMRLGGGCKTPIAAFAQLESDMLHVQGMVASADGERMVKAAVRAPAVRPEAAGELLAQRLLDLGAGSLLQEDAA